jgi:hypothetical protein
MAPGQGTNQNAQVDQQDEPVLATDEIQSVERILSETWDEPSTLRSAEPVWGRRHVVRVVTTSGQAAFVKRPRKPRDVERDENNFAADWSALAFLSDAPGAPVPRVLGGDWPRRLLVIEELPPGRSLAESLLGDDPWAAGNDLVAYAEALARTHLWSLERLEEYKDARAARGLADQPLCGWAHTVDQENQAAFTAVIRELGVADAGLQAELEAELEALYDWLFDGPFLGLVHGDPCPDNVRIVDGICRLFDFEVSGLGSIALDTTYLRAPFPSCWCFGALPSDVADRAASAYEAVLVNGGVRLGAEWTPPRRHSRFGSLPDGACCAERLVKIGSGARRPCVPAWWHGLGRPRGCRAPGSCALAPSLAISPICVLSDGPRRRFPSIRRWPAVHRWRSVPCGLTTAGDSRRLDACESGGRWARGGHTSRCAT